MDADDHAQESDPSDLQQQYEENVGKWGETQEFLERLDEEFLRKQCKLTKISRKQAYISDKDRALIVLALCAMNSSLYVNGIRRQVRSALDAGADVDEVLTVLEWVTALGAHSVFDGLELIVENIDIELASSKQKEQLKRDFLEHRGYWNEELFGDISTADPEWFEAYTDMTGYIQSKDALSNKSIELISIAIDISPTHYFEKGFISHTENAIAEGATIDEILGVLQIVATVGFFSIDEGVPVLHEEAMRRERYQNDD